MAKGQGQGFGFGLGKMKELAEAFKKAQQVQEGAKKLQEELEQMEISGESGGGLVKVVLSGNQEPRRVEISPDALLEGVEVLSDLVTGRDTTLTAVFLYMLRHPIPNYCLCSTLCSCARIRL